MRRMLKGIHIRTMDKMQCVFRRFIPKRLKDFSSKKIQHLQFQYVRTGAIDADFRHFEFHFFLLLGSISSSIENKANRNVFLIFC